RGGRLTFLAPAQAGLFSESQIDHFVMAITSAEAMVWHPPRRPWPLGLCEPDHTARACPGLHFHLLVTGLDSEGGSSWETVIWGIRANSTGGSRQMPSSVRSWRLECW